MSVFHITKIEKAERTREMLRNWMKMDKMDKWNLLL